LLHYLGDKLTLVGDEMMLAKPIFAPLREKVENQL
jgi:hypothetical protein